MKVLYTNMASSVESWLVKAEGVLDASARKIVGLDVEYDKSRDSYFRKKKAAVIQLCYGKDVLVYHIYHADEECPKLRDFLWSWRYIFVGFCIAEDKNVLGRAGLPVHNLKDIQQIWRDPEKSWKRTQGLKDVAAAIIDPYYEQMKDGFGNTEHNMWANAPPLPEKHLEYAARDAYATYEVELLLVYCLYFPKNVCKIVTVVKKAKLIAADGKLSLTHGIPIDIHAHAVSIRTAPAADLVLNPNEKSPPPSEALGAPSIDEAATPISQEDSLPEGAPSIDEAAAPISQEVSLPQDAPSVEDAPLIADASLDVEPAGDTLDEPIPEKELRSKRVHDPVDHISLLIRAKERRSKAIHDDEATNIDVKKPVSKKNPVANCGADNLKAKASAKPKPNENDKAKAKAKANVKSVSFKDDEDDFVDAAGEGSSDDISDDDIEKVHKEKTDVDGDSDETEFDYVGDGKEDIEGGKDDLNDAKEDLQDGTGGEYVEFDPDIFTSQR
ncbi:hypothetical protein ACQ4PT_050704 [Festuca glaucescens]